MDIIETYLQTNGPTLATDIITFIAKNLKISKEAAQKRVSRKVLSHEISKLDLINLKNNTGLLYLQKDYNTSKYWKKLLNVLKQEKSQYYDFIRASIALGGIVSYSEIRIISSSPDLLRGKIRFDMFFNALLDSKIIREIDSSRKIYQINPVIYRNSDINVFDSRQIIFDFFLKGITEWFKSNGLMYSKSIFNQIDSNRTFSHYYYSIAGLSYVMSNSFSNSDSFIVLDFIASEKEVGIEEINYFIKKIESSRKANTKIKFLPFLLAPYFTLSALEECRGKGIIATTVKNLLGQHVDELLSELRNSMKSMYMEIKDNKTDFIKTVHKVNKMYGMTDNLRSKLFEYYIAMIRFYETHLDFEVGKIITEPITFDKAEVDIFQINGNREIHISECKAYTSNIDEDDIDLFIKKIGRVTNWIKNNEIYINVKIFYYYYTISDFTPNGRLAIDNCTRFSIQTFNQKEILTLIDSLRDKDIRKTYNEFFL